MEKKINKLEKFITKCEIKYGNRFDYSNVNYISSNISVTIRCIEHDITFKQVPSEHLRGKVTCTSCRCSRKKIKPTIKELSIIKTNNFIEKCKLVHNTEYDYSKLIYTKSNERVKIICPRHGEFNQVASKHLRGSGCVKCGRLRTKNQNLISIIDFIAKSNKKHNDKYDYSKTNYINSHNKIIIICPKHGDFEQVPYDHISGHGCSKCTSSISNVESEINLFIKSLNIKTISSSRKIIKPLELDIYIPSHNLAIEYNGLYWHSEFYIDKDYHLNKTQSCETKVFN